MPTYILPRRPRQAVSTHHKGCGRNNFVRVASHTLGQWGLHAIGAPVTSGGIVDSILEFLCR